MLKQVHPDTGITVEALAIMNSFVNDVLERIGGRATKMASDLRAEARRRVWVKTQRAKHTGTTTEEKKPEGAKKPEGTNAEANAEVTKGNAAALPGPLLCDLDVLRTTRAGQSGRLIWVQKQFMRSIF